MSASAILATQTFIASLLVAVAAVILTVLVALALVSRSSAVSPAICRAVVRSLLVSLVTASWWRATVAVRASIAASTAPTVTVAILSLLVFAGRG